MVARAKKGDTVLDAPDLSHIEALSTDNTEPMVQYLKAFVGQKIVFSCARYVYWGILSAVYCGRYPVAILAHAVAVEETGPSQSANPRRTDDIGCTIMVSLGALEIVMQPPWSRAKLPFEGGQSGESE